MPNVNIPETETIKSVWIRRREEDNLSRKIMDMVVPGKRRKGRPRRRWIDNNREDMSKYELTADMTENRQYWKMMVKTAWPTNKWRWSLSLSSSFPFVRGEVLPATFLPPHLIVFSTLLCLLSSSSSLPPLLPSSHLS